MATQPEPPGGGLPQPYDAKLDELTRWLDRKTGGAEVPPNGRTVVGDAIGIGVLVPHEQGYANLRGWETVAQTGAAPPADGGDGRRSPSDAQECRAAELERRATHEIANAEFNSSSIQARTRGNAADQKMETEHPGCKIGVMPPAPGLAR